MVLFCISAGLASGQPAEQSTSADAPPTWSWSLLPIVFSSPDTDLAFGLLPQIVFRTAGSDRQSRALLEGYYTLKNQYSLAARGSFWLNEDRDNLDVELVHKYWPTNFYGLDAADTNVPGIDYVERITTLSIGANRRFGPKYRIGVKAGFQNTELLPIDNDSELELGVVHGSDGGWVFYAGPSIGVDSRDHVFFPTAGWLASAVLTFNGSIIGGDYDFVGSRLDVRHFRKLMAHHVLALQIVLDLKSSGVPFWAMKGIGSSVRGYPSARFIDRHMGAVQLEYRIVPALWRVGITIFGGVGTVGHRVADLTKGPFRYAGGAGIRFVFMREAKINIRWDFGFGAGASGDYLDMPEAF